MCVCVCVCVYIYIYCLYCFVQMWATTATTYILFCSKIFIRKIFKCYVYGGKKGKFIWAYKQE